jgi:3-phosphoshikimate 1-carboxyvinyltransferase
VTLVRVPPGAVQGSAVAPPSKSYTHRALVAGHLASRTYVVDSPLDADDTRATGGAIRALGSRVSIARARWTVRPSPHRGAGRARIACGESGTTLRFAAALAAREGHPVELTGRGRLGRRPLSELLEALRALGASASRPRGADVFPVSIRGPIHGGRVALDASRSSQFASALLLALPTVPGDSTLELTGTIVSEPYLEATLAVLRHHRVTVQRDGRRFSIPGSQTFHGRGMRVPGDASSAAYLWSAAAVTGGSVRVEGMPDSWPQADLAILPLLARAGARVRRTHDGAQVSGPVSEGFRVDLTAAPDLYPLAAVIAAAIPHRSELRGAAHVVHKESDRRAGAARLARSMGAEVRVRNGGLEIQGTRTPRRLRIRDLDDHRLVMSAAVAARVGNGISTLGDARVVAKSFPNFWSALEAISEHAA